jgi:hypothetical protein
VNPYRIVWVWSKLMVQRNEQSPFAALQKAFDGIQELNDKLQSPKPTTAAGTGWPSRRRWNGSWPMGLLTMGRAGSGGRCG